MDITADDCFKIPNGLSKGKWAENRPATQNIATTLYWKDGFDKEYQEVEFLQKTIFTLIKMGKWPIFNSKLKNGSLGISNTKKESIFDNLCPLMPEKSIIFWNELEKNNLPDLGTNLW